MNLGRNAPCICGSGKKYKKCCGQTESALPAAQNEINHIAALLNAGQLAEAEKRVRSLVEQCPDSGFAWKALGVILKLLGKDSLPALRKATEFLPDDAEAHKNLGIVLHELGRFDEAEASYRRALRIMPNYADAYYNLGNTLVELGCMDEAEACYRSALQNNPGHVAVYYNLGNTLAKLKRLDEAEASYRRALQLKPDFVEAHSNLGNTLVEMGRMDEAEAIFRRVLQLKPDSAEAHSNLGDTLMEMGRLDEAEASCRRALQLKPDFVEAHSNLGNTLVEMGRMDEAEAIFRRVLQLKPDSADAHIDLGNILKERGRMDEAEASYRVALQLKPDYIGARYGFASVGKVQAGDENLAALIAIEQTVRNGKTPLPDKEMVLLHFALGKSYDDLGDYEKAFPHFLAGCKLKRATFDYDPEQDVRLFASIMRTFDHATLDRLRGGGDPSPLPVFILGMPRSGTTLTEQIIASHSEVHGAGELPDLTRIAWRDIAGAAFPDNLHSLDHVRLSAWGAEYVAGLQRRAPDARRITDKMPGNFMVLGLIHLMLPHAKIIHVKRNPVDTCLSCFTTLFKHKHEHTYDLAELGRYYAGYARLMEHWRKVLPKGAFLDVQYEDIVADQETQSRRLIEYCGLEWNDACLDFHKSKRAVRTASVMQVRRPMYKSSVERWRNYEKFLGPLLDALGEFAPSPER